MIGQRQQDAMLQLAHRSVWVDDPYGRSLNQSHLNEAISFALKEAGVKIAYPQVDLHFDQATLDVVRSKNA